MATLRLRIKPKRADLQEISEAGALNTDDIDFIEFRNKFYLYQYEFGKRSKTISDDLLSIYFKKTNDKYIQDYFGATLDDISDELKSNHILKYTIDLYFDFRLSKRKAKDIFNKTADEIWQQVESIFYKRLNNNNHSFMSEFPLTANGKKADVTRLFEVWEKALKVYDLHEIQDKKNYAEISRELKWFNEIDRHHCSDEVRKYLEYAKRLIEAASKNALYEEACKPVMIGKKRKKISQ